MTDLPHFYFTWTMLIGQRFYYIDFNRIIYIYKHFEAHTPYQISLFRQTNITVCNYTCMHIYMIYKSHTAVILHFSSMALYASTQHHGTYEVEYLIDVANRAYTTKYITFCWFTFFLLNHRLIIIYQQSHVPIYPFYGSFSSIETESTLKMGKMVKPTGKGQQQSTPDCHTYA